MKDKKIAVIILLILLFGIVGVIFAQPAPSHDPCSSCRGSGTSCPFNSNHTVTIPAPSGDEAHCSICKIDFNKFNCRPCGGTGQVRR